MAQSVKRLPSAQVTILWSWPLIIMMGKKVTWWGTWVAQSVKRLPSAQVMIPESWDQALHWASCTVGSLLLPLPFPPSIHALSLSLSLSNK